MRRGCGLVEDVRRAGLSARGYTASALPPGAARRSQSRGRIAGIANTKIPIDCPKCGGTTLAYDSDEVQSPEFAAVGQACGHRPTRADIDVQK
jgi:hypothetical protein